MKRNSTPHFAASPYTPGAPTAPPGMCLTEARLYIAKKTLMATDLFSHEESVELYHHLEKQIKRMVSVCRQVVSPDVHIDNIRD